MSLRGVSLVLGTRCWFALLLGWMEVKRAGKVPIGGFYSGGDLAGLLSSRFLAAIRLLARLFQPRSQSVGVAL
jgi:hypothetical protein